MGKQVTKRSAALRAVPQLPYETLYVGIDVGKYAHYAGFVSRTLLQRHDHFEGCPALTFGQSREGFRALVDRIGELVPVAQATGSWSRPVTIIGRWSSISKRWRSQSMSCQYRNEHLACSRATSGTR